MDRFLIWIIVFVLYQSYQSEAQIITTIAGNGIHSYGGDGSPGTAAELFTPSGVCADAIGNLYIADYFNMRIRKLDTAGIITTIAGDGTPAFGGDGGPATDAQLYYPVCLCLDKSGNLYFSDYENDRVRKINSAGIISTVAGNGVNGDGGDGGPATTAQLFQPGGICTDATGNLYITDVWNSRVRKVNTRGIISTFAGNGVAAYSGDGGPATAAELNAPNSVCIDAQGNVYIADDANYRIRKVDTSGIISTFAGTGMEGYSGDGGPATAAQFYGGTGLTMDAAGNLYFTDVVNFVIRKISISGIISTVVGSGIQGYSGDGGPALSAELNQADDVYSDAAGNLYIADQNNNRIRKVSVAHTSVTPVANYDNDFKVYPNPATNSIYFQFPAGDVTIRLMDITGRLLNEQMVHNNSSASINVIGYTPSLYIYEVITGGKTKSGKIIIEQ